MNNNRELERYKKSEEEFLLNLGHLELNDDISSGLPSKVRYLSIFSNFNEFNYRIQRLRLLANFPTKEKTFLKFSTFTKQIQGQYVQFALKS